MPAEAPPAPPPAAPSAPPAAPAAPPPAELHVTPQTVADKGPPPEPPKKGSVREQMFSDLRKKAGAEPEPPKPAEPPKPTEGEKGEVVPPTEGGEGEKGSKGGRPNPWKLMEEHKTARLKLEQEMAELRKTLPDPAKVKEQEESFKSLQARAQELEEEIRYVNYSKSKEFQEKYQLPYENAWKKAMADLGELTVADDVGGNERPIAPQDMLALVNMPLKEARAKAAELFGDFADDVMAHRKEIRNLFEAQSNALEEARKTGVARDQERQKQWQEAHEGMRKTVNELWKQSNEEALKDEKVNRFFRPVEGDEEGNKRLARGFELADRAFAVTPLNPQLTAEQRADIVRLHSAIRHRAAAFGRMQLLVERAETKVKTLEAELAKYKSAEPGKGEGNTHPSAAPSSGSAWDQMRADLAKRAH